MAVVRFLIPTLVGSLLMASQVTAQDATGNISGRVVDSTTQQPLSSVNVRVVGTQRGTITRDAGEFLLIGVPAGTYRVRASRIGHGPQEQSVTVTPGGTATANFVLPQLSVSLEAMVVTGYTTQRREAITGSIATVNADEANVGVVTNVNSMIQGRAAGVNVTQNSGEPGAGAQIRIRGGTSISASNEPLYVIDGVAIRNVETEAAGVGISDNTPALPRNPLNLLNPSDIASISILKDASATAIYGSRGANGVILIETKKGAAGKATMEYEVYAASSSPAKYLDILDGNQYRNFVQEQVDLGNLLPASLDALGSANTDWERAVTRTSMTYNHNLSFSGGSEATRYRASLNYMDQQGVVLANGFKRYQGRLNATHSALDSRLRLGLNLTASNIKNDYTPADNTGGFEGAVFQNMVTFNPTKPVRVTDALGQSTYFETGPGSQSARNPVALAEQLQDFGNSTRILSNITADLDVVPGLTAKINAGVDRSDGTRQTYYPNANPVGADFGGMARQVNRDNTSLTLTTLLSFNRQFRELHDFEIIGGYEFNDYALSEFGARGEGFLTDAFSYNNLGAASNPKAPTSLREESRLVSFLSKANYAFKDRYFLTGSLRKDGSSNFGVGNKWAVFKGLGVSWRISEEPFMPDLSISELRLRVGVGQGGNPGVAPYSSLILLSADGGSRYVFGENAVTGVSPVRNPNPNLKWEQTTSSNVAVDYGFLENRFTGTLEYYVKKTSDLLLTVDVPPPAVAAQRLENIGKTKNNGLEFSLDADVLTRPKLSWTAGLVFARERGEVVDLGNQSFIRTGRISGKGQSGAVSQRIIPGYALGTFYGPEFVRVNADGKEEFNKYTVTRDVDGNITSRELTGVTTSSNLTGDDLAVIGDANPDWTLGLHSRVDWNGFDASILIRSEQGRDVFNNTALVYGTKGNAKQGQNFLASALDDGVDIDEPATYSSRWIEDGSFVRLQNLTVGYTFDLLPRVMGQGRRTRVYLSGDNLLLMTDYNGYDPEVHVDAGLATRGIDYLTYPRARTITGGVRVTF